MVDNLGSPGQVDVGPVYGRDAISRRIIRNFGIAFGAQGIAAALGLLALALNARVLEAAGLGILALITTMATLLGRTFALQSWIPLIKFGSAALEKRDTFKASQYTTVSLLFGAMGAAAATGIGVALMFLFGNELGIPNQYVPFAALYMATLATGIADTPTGLLRLLNRFSVLSSIQIGGALLGCLLALSLFLVGAPLTAYILGYASVAVLVNISIVAAGIIVARRAGIGVGAGGIARAWREVGREFWTFSWPVSLSGTIYVVRENAPHMVIGAVLGPGAVGIYHVASRITLPLSMVMSAVHQAFLPEAARLATAARYAKLTRFIFRTGVACALVGALALLVMTAWGRVVLLALAGIDYLAAYWPMVALICATTISMAGVGLRSAIVVTAGPGVLLRAIAISLAILIVVLPLGLVAFGLTGGACAQIMFDVVSLLILTKRFKQWNRHVTQPV